MRLHTVLLWSMLGVFMSGVTLFAGAAGGCAPKADGGSPVTVDAALTTLACDGSVYAGAACAIPGATCLADCVAGSGGNATCGKEGVWRFAVTCEPQPPPASAPFPCGSETCGVMQFCVVPCCGGAPGQCVQPADGGACPDRMHLGRCDELSSPLTGQQACVDDDCTPPPPKCQGGPDCPSEIDRSNARVINCSCY